MLATFLDGFLKIMKTLKHSFAYVACSFDSPSDIFFEQKPLNVSENSENIFRFFIPEEICFSSMCSSASVECSFENWPKVFRHNLENFFPDSEIQSRKIGFFRKKNDVFDQKVPLDSSKDILTTLLIFFFFFSNKLSF